MGFIDEMIDKKKARSESYKTAQIALAASEISAKSHEITHKNVD